MATSAGAQGALDAKTKELIALAISVAVRCDDCIAFHAKAAAQRGATREEVMETLGMSVYMGAGPSVMYASHALAAFTQFDAGKTAEEERKTKMSLAAIFSKLGGGELPTIEHEDFVRVVQDGSCAIVDVREPHEYAAGHVPGAQNMPLSQFRPRRSCRKASRSFIMCQAGGRSAKALTQAHSRRTARMCATTRRAPAAGARAAARSSECEESREP